MCVYSLNDKRNRQKAKSRNRADVLSHPLLNSRRATGDEGDDGDGGDDGSERNEGEKELREMKKMMELKEMREIKCRT